MLVGGDQGASAFLIRLQLGWHHGNSKLSSLVFIYKEAGVFLLAFFVKFFAFRAANYDYSAELIVRRALDFSSEEREVGNPIGEAGEAHIDPRGK